MGCPDTSPIGTSLIYIKIQLDLYKNINKLSSRYIVISNHLDLSNSDHSMDHLHESIRIDKTGVLPPSQKMDSVGSVVERSHRMQEVSVRALTATYVNSIADRRYGQKRCGTCMLTGNPHCSEAVRPSIHVALHL